MRCQFWALELSIIIARPLQLLQLSPVSILVFSVLFLVPSIFFAPFFYSLSSFHDRIWSNVSLFLQVSYTFLVVIGAYNINLLTNDQCEYPFLLSGMIFDQKNQDSSAYYTIYCLANKWRMIFHIRRAKALQNFSSNEFFFAFVSKCLHLPPA